jgi:hypothetical protein
MNALPPIIQHASFIYTVFGNLSYSREGLANALQTLFYMLLSEKLHVICWFTVHFTHENLPNVILTPSLFLSPYISAATRAASSYSPQLEENPTRRSSTTFQRSDARSKLIFTTA